MTNEQIRELVLRCHYTTEAFNALMRGDEAAARAALDAWHESAAHEAAGVPGRGE